MCLCVMERVKGEACNFAVQDSAHNKHDGQCMGLVSMENVTIIMKIWSQFNRAVTKPFYPVLRDICKL